MSNASSTTQTALERVLEVMARLRDPDNGCPWDQAQTFATIVPFTLEEAYEVADAIAREDYAELRAELGDLLFQVVFYCQMAKEKNLFDFDEVASGLVDKLQRRHPHVFGDESFVSVPHLHQLWEQRKAREREQKLRRDTPMQDSIVSVLDDIPLAMPALSRAQKLQKRASSVGFDWVDPAPVLARLHEELVELSAAQASGDRDAVEDEMGDVLFSCVNLARHLDLNAEAALRRASDKFSRRFRQLELAVAADGHQVSAMSTEVLEQYWQRVKLDEKPADQSS